MMYKMIAGMIEKLVCLFGYLYMLLLFLCFIPDLFGFQKYIVSSGSMEPQVPVGSCVFVKKTGEDEISAGDIITYCMPEADIVVTHRVAAYDADSGCFRTKGDANEQADAGEITYDQILGVVQFCVPLLGYFLAIQNIHGVKLFGIALILFVAFLKMYREEADWTVKIPGAFREKGRSDYRIR